MISKNAELRPCSISLYQQRQSKEALRAALFLFLYCKVHFALYSCHVGELYLTFFVEKGDAGQFIHSWQCLTHLAVQRQKVVPLLARPLVYSFPYKAVIYQLKINASWLCVKLKCAHTMPVPSQHILGCVQNCESHSCLWQQLCLVAADLLQHAGNFSGVMLECTSACISVQAFSMHNANLNKL